MLFSMLKKRQNLYKFILNPIKGSFKGELKF